MRRSRNCAYRGDLEAGRNEIVAGTFKFRAGRPASITGQAQCHGTWSRPSCDVATHMQYMLKLALLSAAVTTAHHAVDKSTQQASNRESSYDKMKGFLAVT